MMNYPWLQEYIDKWLELIHNNKAPHAILLSGAKGLAKRSLASSMAHIAVCENLTEYGACNACKGCHLFDAGNHTDIKTITAEKETIKVEQIRNLSKDVVISSTRNQYRIMIIEDAEKMNKASANALLKTLEEPPKNVIIILTTSEIAYLLPTIKSRCFKINIKTIEPIKLSRYLTDKKLGTTDEIDQAIVLASHSPLVAKDILENKTLDVVKSMLNDLDMLVKKQKTVIEVTKEWIKTEQTKYLLLVSAYFLSVVKNLNNLEENNALSKLSKVDYTNVSQLNTKALYFIKSLFTFVSRQRTPLKKELLLEELLFEWQNDFQN